MTDLKVTDARIALLRDVANSDVEVYASARLGGAWSTADVYLKRPYEVERKVTKQVEVLEQARLVERRPCGVRYHAPRPYTLTDAGREWLASAEQESGR